MTYQPEARMLQTVPSDDNDSCSSEGEANPRLDDLIRAHKNHTDLAPDAWGMGVVCIVKDLADILDGHYSLFHCFRFGFSFTVLILNVGFQFFLLRQVWYYIVRPSVHTVQSNYRSYHSDIFDKDGNMIAGAWDAYPTEKKEQLCQTALSIPFFLWALMMYWVTRMVQEMRETDRLRRNIRELPALPSGARSSEMVHEKESDDDDGINEIIALNTSTRVSLYVLIVIPKFLVCIALLLLGCRYLGSTEAFETLILNAMALEFIVNADELAFNALFPVSACKEIEIVKFAHAKKDLTNEQKESIKVQGYARSVLTLLVIFAVVAIYQSCFQQIIPGYKLGVLDLCVL